MPDLNKNNIFQPMLKLVRHPLSYLLQEMMDNDVFGSCILGIGNSIGELHNKWKRQLQLKLI